MRQYPYQIKTHIIAGEHIREYPHGTAHDGEDTLLLQVKQYTPLNNPNPKPGDVTIIAAHANGLPKELYEPLWEDLLTRLNARGVSIRNIWIADIAQQSASAVLNESKLGNDPSWFDHSRDLIQLINHFRDQMKRPLVGIGHSVGAAALTNLSLFHPRLLETLILIEPTIYRESGSTGTFMPAASSARRRDHWPSRAAAVDGIRKNNFYKTWDDRVREQWIKYGLRDVSTGTQEPTADSAKPKGNDESSDPAVVLSTSKHQEVFLYGRPIFNTYPQKAGSNESGNENPPASDFDPDSMFPDTDFYRPEPVKIFHMLPTLRPSVLYVFGETSMYSEPEMRADKLTVTGTGIGGSGGAERNAVVAKCIPGLGHMVPFEAVTETATYCAEWLERQMAAWEEREDRINRTWKTESGVQKRTMGPEFKRLIDDGMDRMKRKSKGQKL